MLLRFWRTCTLSWGRQRNLVTCASANSRMASRTRRSRCAGTAAQSSCERSPRAPFSGAHTMLRGSTRSRRTCDRWACPRRSRARCARTAPSSAQISGSTTTFRAATSRTSTSRPRPRPTVRPSLLARRPSPRGSTARRPLLRWSTASAARQSAATSGGRCGRGRSSSAPRTSGLARRRRSGSSRTRRRSVRRARPREGTSTRRGSRLTRSSSRTATCARTT
mmetsp:Transcript_12999/g.40969  ORF Transcript_12999/g.40969 Transcript_12999/m.40969 type:complete len:222 (-) Transcript_12999:739-1404(-)